MDSHVKSVDTDAKFHIHDKPGKDQDDPTPGSQAILHGHTGTRGRTLQLPSRRPGSGEVATDGIRLYTRSNTAAALNQPSINFSTTELSLSLIHI